MHNDPLIGRDVRFVSIETCAYSGATLLAFLLGSHPRIATVGEMDGLVGRNVARDEYLCSCGQRIASCAFWHEVQTLMRRHGFDFDVLHFNMKCNRGRLWFSRRFRSAYFRSRQLSAIRDLILRAVPGEVQRARQLIRRNEALVQAVLDITGKDHFVDSSKDALRLRYMLQFSSFDVHVVHLVRDVRGVVASHLRHKNNGRPRAIAQFWVNENARVEQLINTLPATKWIRVRYDDVCIHPQRTLTKLFRFLGLNPIAIDFRTVTHHIVGNSMRLAHTTSIELDQRWKTMLGHDTLREVNRIAGSLNRRYGYD